jgi:hypothetical protein
MKNPAGEIDLSLDFLFKLHEMATLACEVVRQPDKVGS